VLLTGNGALHPPPTPSSEATLLRSSISSDRQLGPNGGVGRAGGAGGPSAGNQTSTESLDTSKFHSRFSKRGVGHFFLFQRPLFRDEPYPHTLPYLHTGGEAWGSYPVLFES